jgi:hypothetical protein
MMGRVRWSHVTIALALIAALAIAAPAIGGPSLKKLVKKEVAKQISKATGPAGANGASGANGTARAYALVSAHSSVACSPNCHIDRSKGISTVTRIDVGHYCIHGSGIDPTAVSPAVTVDWGATANPEGNASAMTGEPCDSNSGFSVFTERHSDSASTNAAPADDVGFTIVIP